MRTLHTLAQAENIRTRLRNQVQEWVIDESPETTLEESSRMAEYLTEYLLASGWVVDEPEGDTE